MAVGHPSKSMHNVHVKASEGAESSGVTAFRNVACLVKYDGGSSRHLAPKNVAEEKYFMHQKSFKSWNLEDMGPASF